MLKILENLDFNQYIYIFIKLAKSNSKITKINYYIYLLKFLLKNE